MMFSKVALYSSYQVGEDLPGYVQFALQHLSETDFHVVLLTNRRPLSERTRAFLEEHNIELFLTENHGFDFGMWRRYLKTKVKDSLQSLERLLLINDSIVYFQNNFQEFFRKAEEHPADAISLTMAQGATPHLQSFFLYLKQEALGAFYLHILETPEQETFYDVVERLETPLGAVFAEAEVTTDALFPTDREPLFSYPELIREKAGFIKRKLLQHRFNTAEKMHFIRYKAFDALTADYRKIVLKAGLAEDFREDWLPSPIGNAMTQKRDAILEQGIDKVAWPLLRAAIKTKYKLLGKKLEGEEYR